MPTGWLVLCIAFRVLRQVSKSETELYDLFTPYWVMGLSYIVVGMREPCDRGHKRVCYALVNRESPTQPYHQYSGVSPSAVEPRKTLVLRLLPIADDVATVRAVKVFSLLSESSFYRSSLSFPFPFPYSIGFGDVDRFTADLDDQGL